MEKEVKLMWKYNIAFYLGVFVCVLCIFKKIWWGVFIGLVMMIVIRILEKEGEEYE